MENINSVCFVAKINEINKIEGADKIVQAVLEGWSCIVQKDQYLPGDLVVVATTDAILPDKLAEALNVTNYLRKGNRVRTIKLKGVYSECLTIPITLIPEKYRYEGADCMELLEIFKWEPPVKQIQLSSGRKIKYKDNPNFQVYYKFPNIKNVKGIFNEDDKVQITRKIHGTNARYGIVKRNKFSTWYKIKKFLHLTNKWDDYEFVYGSHNVEKGSESQGFYQTDVWRTVMERRVIKNKLWNFVKSNETPDTIGSGIMLYGEVYGAGIQKGYDYGMKDIDVVFFDMTVNGEYMPTFVTEVIIKDLDLPHVEILYEGYWSQEIQDKLVLNNFIKGTKIPEEGVVIKNHDGNRAKTAKVINPDYLIFAEKNDIGDSH